MLTPLMKCGHSANSEHNGKPSCVICAGIKEGWDEVADVPNLEGRMARCAYYGTIPRGRLHEGSKCKRGEMCLCEESSSTDLAFFEYDPKKEYDRFYCGCWGWD